MILLKRKLPLILLEHASRIPVSAMRIGLFFILINFRKIDVHGNHHDENTCWIMRRKLLLIDIFSSVFKKDCSPGPGYFIDATISRTGRDGTPSYSILGRQKDASKFNLLNFASMVFYSVYSNKDF